MTAAYIQSFETYEDQCREALKTENTDQLKAAIHDIKALALTIGAEELGALSRNIEQTIEQRKGSEALALTAQIFPLIRQMTEIIEEYRSREFKA